MSKSGEELHHDILTHCVTSDSLKKKKEYKEMYCKVVMFTWITQNGKRCLFYFPLFYYNTDY